MAGPNVVLYTRQSCHLCDQAKEVLRRKGLSPREIDIDQDAQLRERFDECVPVVEIDGKVRFRGRVNEILLGRLLAGHQSGHQTGHQDAVDERADRQGLIGMRQMGVLAKYWAPGRVKTRLAATIGEDRAAALYRACLETILCRFANLPVQRVLAYTPVTRQAQFAQLAGRNWRLQAQSEGDLGDRMKTFFRDAFAGGCRQVVLIGADSPTLPRRYVDQAFAALDEVPVVLGPSDDGGYYLVGAAERTPDIFDAISWSSSAVWQQTVDRLDASGTAFARLPAWYDVDDQQAMDRLRVELWENMAGDRDLDPLRDALATIERKT